MRRSLIGIAGILCLAACTSTPPSVVFVARCPTVVNYSKDFQQRLADYVARLTVSPELARYLDDSENLRRQVKACNSTVQSWQLDKVEAPK